MEIKKRMRIVIRLSFKFVNVIQKAYAKDSSKGRTLGFPYGEHWQDGDFVFTQENGLPLDPGTPSHLFGKMIKKAGLRNIRLHDLRHLHATELLRLGEPLHVVAQRLGHRDAMVTATIYAHVSNEQDETASQKFANATKRAI
jgi:integrase